MAQKNKLPQIARQTLRLSLKRQTDLELEAYVQNMDRQIREMSDEVQYRKELCRMAQAELERRRRGSSGSNIVG